MKSHLIAGAIAAAAISASLAAGAPRQAPSQAPRPQMSRDAVETQVRAKFIVADADLDGTITRAELDAAGKARRQARFDALDVDKDGRLSRAEFYARPARADQAGMSGDRPGRRLAGATPGRWFAMADADKDGRVTTAEANTAAFAQFDKVDTDKDGTISPDERRAGRAHFRAAWMLKRG